MSRRGRRGRKLQVGWAGPEKRLRWPSLTFWNDNRPRFDDNDDSGVFLPGYPPPDLSTDDGVDPPPDPFNNPSDGNINVYVRLTPGGGEATYTLISSLTYDETMSNSIGVEGGWSGPGIGSFDPATFRIWKPIKCPDPQQPIGSLPSSNPFANAFDNMKLVGNQYGRQHSVINSSHSSGLPTGHILPGPVGIFLPSWSFPCAALPGYTPNFFAVWGG